MNSNFTKDFLLTVLWVLPGFILAQEGARRRENFDFDWKFLLNDSTEAAAQVHDDSKWEAIQLPHDWSIKLPVPGR